jgi:hypothetical protein
LIHPGILKCPKIGPDSRLNHRFINRVGLEELTSKLPKFIGSTLHATMAFLCSVT